MRSRLPGGLHEVDTALHAISLADLLEVERAPRTELVVTGMPLTVEDNLVLRAQRELEAAAGRRLPARFRLHKRIPAGAGLGGGSSDAAAALRALAAVYGLALDLRPVAARVGADVPFFLCGGSAEAGGRGEVLRPARLATGWWFAIAWPGFGVSTAAVYRAWDEVGGEGPNELERAAFTVEPRLRDFAARLGERWLMTGSGSAYFSLHTSEAGARAALAGLDDVWTCVARPVASWC